MINKYTRTQINLKTALHDKEFALIEDVEKLIMSVIGTAIKAGADDFKFMELLELLDE